MILMILQYTAILQGLVCPDLGSLCDFRWTAEVTLCYVYYEWVKREEKAFLVFYRNFRPFRFVFD